VEMLAAMPRKEQPFSQYALEFSFQLVPTALHNQCCKMKKLLGGFPRGLLFDGPVNGNGM
jgi:hypothetical protein